ncbi:MAG: hypothetical protein ACD_73C00667G0002 [uncultured bacterium]|nr:MAG: hypothetical protein ACD_73C00667G0002 [uncultured bacterium]
MNTSMGRIRAMFLRYLYLHKRSVSRVLELIFWPVMELFVWGFVSLYIRQYAPGELGRIIVFLMSGIIFWDLLYRSQQAVTISFIEDIWTQNILNILISPLRIHEWFITTFLYGLIKTIFITLILAAIAYGAYQFNLMEAMGFYMLPLMFNLLLFGWALGMFTSGMLIRWGHSVEALIWGIPFLVQPLSAIYYPLEVLPAWAQKWAVCLPSTHIFEGMRQIIKSGHLDSHYVWASFYLNIIYFILAALFFKLMYQWSRATGRLGHLGMD